MTLEDCRTEMESLDMELRRLLERRARLLVQAQGLKAERRATHADAATASRPVGLPVEGSSHPAHHTEVGELP